MIKKNVIMFFLVLFVFLLFSGCTTTSPKKNGVDFTKGGVISFVAADRRPDSLLFARAFMRKYEAKDGFTVVPESKIKEAFTDYPLNIFPESIIVSVKLTGNDRAIMRKVGDKLGGDFICFVSFSFASETGGVVMYDVKNDSVMTAFNFRYSLEPRGFFSTVFYIMFVRDYDKYYEKKLDKCVDFLERKELASL